MSGLGMTEKTAASDGHCILHSVSGALELQTGVARSVAQMFQLVLSEVSEHAEYYKNFSPDNKDIMDEVIRWSMDRVFDRDSVDLIFSILCSLHITE